MSSLAIQLLFQQVKTRLQQQWLFQNYLHLPSELSQYSGTAEKFIRTTLAISLSAIYSRKRINTHNSIFHISKRSKQAIVYLMRECRIVIILIMKTHQNSYNVKLILLSIVQNDLWANSKQCRL